MSSEMKLFGVTCQVAEPGTAIEIVALVMGENNKPEPGKKINWTLSKNYYGAKLSAESSMTDEDGKALITIECEKPAALKLNAVVDGSANIKADIKVGFSDTSNLTELKIPQEDNGILDEDDVRGMVQVVVNRRSRINADSADSYYLFWGNERIGTVSSINDEDFGKPWGVDVTKSRKSHLLLADGTHPVYYYIEDSVGNITYSPVKFVTVTGGTYTNPIYDMPLFPNLKYNTVNIESVHTDNGLVIKLPEPQTNDSAIIRDGYFIKFYMEAKDTRTQKVKVKEKVVHTVVYDKDVIEYVIDKKHLIDEKSAVLDGVYGYFWYSVHQKDGGVEIGTSEKKRLFIDTVRPQMPEPDLNN